MSLKNLVDRAFGEVGCEIKNGETLYYCPKCRHHKPKMSVNLETGNWKCWVCGPTQKTTGKSIRTLFNLLHVGGSFYEELKKYKLVRQDYVHTDTEEHVALPDEFRSLTIPNKRPEYKQAMNYLKRRGISLEEIIKYNIGFCYEGEYKDRIIIPSYDENAQLNYFIARTWIKDHIMPYKNPPISKNVVGLELFVNWSLNVNLCEGVFDAISIRRNAIPMFGKTLNSSIKLAILRNRPPSVTLCLDGDAVNDAIDIQEWLDTNNIPCKMVWYENEDASEMGYSKNWKLINSATELSFIDKLRMKI